MTHPMPAEAPALIRHQAELQDLRWVAQQLVSSHDRYAQRTGAFSQCLCSLCKHARPWVEPGPRFCAGMDEREPLT